MNRSRIRRTAAAGIGAALFGMGLAYGQDDSTADGVSASEPSPPVIPVNVNRSEEASVAEPSHPETQRVAEIIVVAQKREQRLQDVPVSVSVVSQKQLESQNISDVSDLARAVPSVELNGPSGNYNSKISIRGLSTESYSRTAEQAVSFVLDGVVLGKAPTTTLFDINQVEVLRGPQGTLFGKNASAGVINIITNAPDTTRFSAAGRVDFGSEYDYRLLQAAVNIPLTDDLAVRFNAGQTYYTGLVHNNVSDQDNKQDAKGGRMRLLWRPTDTLTVNLIGDYEQQYVSEQIYPLFKQYVDRATQEPRPLPGCGDAYASDTNLIACNGDPTFADREAYGYSAQIDWEIGDYALTSISALRRYHENSAADVDGLPGSYFRNGNVYDNRVFTQELRIASPAEEDLSYVAGLYYFDTKIPNTLTQTIGADGAVAVAAGALGLSLCADYGLCLGELASVLQPNEFTAKTRSEAVFGELTYRLSDDLRVLAGGRYTRDEVAMKGAAYASVGSQIDLLNALLAAIPQATVTELEAREVVDNFSWRLGVQYDVLDNVMSYFTVSNGYKGPQIVFNPPVLLPSINGGATQPHGAYVSVVRPEYPRAYELGVKSSFFGGAVVANTSVFYTDVRDYQSSQFNDNAEFVPINISSVVSKGVELDLFGFLTRGWMANLGLLYNKVTYPDNYLWPCTQVGHGCAGTSSSDYENIGGEQLPAAPEWKVTLASEYQFNLFSGVNAFISGDMVYRSDMRFTPNHDTRTEVDARTVIGARLGLRGEESNWEVSLFGRNLTNEENPTYMIAPYLTDELSSPGKDTAGHVLSTESLRFFGVSAVARF